MNMPIDAHLKNEFIVEEAESLSKRESERHTPVPLQANRLPEESEGLITQSAEDFVVPTMEALCLQDQHISQEKFPEEALLKTALVVDDLPVNRKLIGIQLKKLGYTFDQADNGQAALEMVQSNDYAMIFMDLDMPIMDGYQAAIAIRLWDHENRQHTPIVGMTSSKKQSEHEKTVTSGMDDYISKGAASKNLAELLARFPRKKKQLTTIEREPEVKDGVLIDLELLQDAHGPYESEGLIDLAIGTMKTFLGCLKCALDDKDLSSIMHFSNSMKEPCALLGLNSMRRLSARIASDANNADWQSAHQGMELLESQYSQILDQLTGLSATHHRVD